MRKMSCQESISMTLTDLCSADTVLHASSRILDVVPADVGQHKGAEGGFKSTCLIIYVSQAHNLAWQQDK